MVSDHEARIGVRRSDGRWRLPRRSLPSSSGLRVTAVSSAVWPRRPQSPEAGAAPSASSVAGGSTKLNASRATGVETGAAVSRGASYAARFVTRMVVELSRAMLRCS